MQKAYTKKHLRYLHQVLPKVKCAICSIRKDNNQKIKLVWDHNHSTNIVRGVLCELCNSYLFLYDEYQKYKHLGIDLISCYGMNFYVWIREYESNIIKHLNSNTGIHYSNINSFIKKCQQQGHS